MKYLKLFESIIDYITDSQTLKEFVIDNISYLLDKGVYVHVLPRDNSLHLLISYTGLSWDDISYEIVPLLIRLKQRYYFSRINDGNSKTNSTPNIKIAGSLYNYFDIIKDREITKTIGSGALILYLIPI